MGILLRGDRCRLIRIWQRLSAQAKNSSMSGKYLGFGKAQHLVSGETAIRSKMEGWLCPALLEYFAAAPKTIYIQAEPKS